MTDQSDAPTGVSDPPTQLHGEVGGTSPLLAMDPQHAGRAPNKKHPLDYLAVTIAAFALMVSVSSGLFSYFQWDSRRQEMRPWISASLTGTVSTLSTVGGQISLAVKYHLKNVGKQPAVRVFPYTTLVPIAGGAPEFSKQIKAACDNFIQQMNDDVAGAGTTIFPDETIESRVAIDDVKVVHFSGVAQKAFLVPVCAVYKFPNSEGPFHYTSAAYLLTGVGMSNIDLAHLPAEGLIVELYPLAQGNIPPT